MRLIKLAAISVAVLFVVITLIGLLFPSKVIVSRVVDILQPVDSVYSLTKDLYGWQKWVKSMQNQPVLSATKSKIGNSTIAIIAASSSKISGKWIEKNGDEQTFAINIIANQNNSIVNWQFEQDVKWYPWARLGSMVNEKVIGAMMEENLASLKKVSEEE